MNTSYVVTVSLDNQSVSGEKTVSILIAAFKFLLLQWDTVVQNLDYSEWIEFTKRAAKALQEEFSSFNNLIDLLPQYQDSSAV